MAFAAQYHVTVIPELDKPAHMRAILANRSDLWLGVPQEAPTPPAIHSGQLDLSQPDKMNLAGDLVREFLLLFPGPIWHTEADEYDGDPNQLVQFINEIDAIVQFNGKTLRMWSGTVSPPALPALHSDIQIEYYEQWHSAMAAELASRRAAVAARPGRGPIQGDTRPRESAAI